MTRLQKGIKAKVGDIFLVPLDASYFAVGQIIAIRDKHELYVAVFCQRLRRQDVDLNMTIVDEPQLLCLTLDAKIFHGDWPIIGNSVVAIDRHPEPIFKVIHNGSSMVESRDMSFRRSATDSEIKTLNNRTVSYPQLVENATKACFGLLDWSINYDKFFAENVKKSSEMIMRPI